MADLKFGEIRNVEVFAVGTWKAATGTFTATSEMLDQMVRGFNELSAKVSGFRPPLKLGHTDAQRFLGQNNGAPALGWVAALRRIGDKVVADFADVPSSLIDLIQKRLYNSVSIEVMPKISYQGLTFENVLSAVAVLGAELPAVKGLKELSLSLFDASCVDRIVLSEKEQGQQMAGEATYTQAQLDALTEAAVTKATAAVKAEFGTQIEAIKAEFTAKVTAAETAKTEAEKKLADAEKSAKEFAASQAKATIEAVVDQAIKEGKLLPKDKAATVAFAQSLDQTTKIKFSEKVECSAFDHWKTGLLAGKKVMSFAEKTVAGGGTDDDKAADVEVNERATAKVSAAGGSDKLAFATAVQIVLNEDPALKARYASLG